MDELTYPTDSPFFYLSNWLAAVCCAAQARAEVSRLAAYLGVRRRAGDEEDGRAAELLIVYALQGA